MLAVAGRGCALDQVDLLSAGVQPRPTEPEVRPVDAPLEPERVAVEAQRRVDVVDVDGHVVHRQWPHGASLVLGRPAAQWLAR